MACFRSLCKPGGESISRNNSFQITGSGLLTFKQCCSDAVNNHARGSFQKLASALRVYNTTTKDEKVLFFMSLP